jgi:hypothetical protein
MYFRFDAWYPNEDGTGIPFTNMNVFPTTVYAKWDSIH